MPNYQLSIPVNEDDHFQGNENASIILVEYGDYQCPHCGQAYPIIKQIQKDFGDQLGFVFRNFPLAQMHPNAFQAAEAAELAADEGKFWKMHDSLYEDQERLAKPDLVRRANALDMDAEKFLYHLENNSKQEKVKDDFMGGVESGVGGTPSFFINGDMYEGSWDYDSLKNYLENYLDS